MTLTRIGFDPGPQDGIFGANTEAAVKQFQESQALDVDGKVGPDTQAALCSELQDLSIESGVGTFVGPGEAGLPSPNLPPENAEPEDLEANLGQAELEKNEANSNEPDFAASLEEKNVTEPQIIESQTNNSFAPVVNNSFAPGVTSASPLVSSTGAGGTTSLNSTTFEGISQADTPFAPPDVALAVGVRRIVEMVNGAFQVFEKVGDKLLPDRVFTANALFRIGVTDPVDPAVVYDPVTKRFFASVFDLPSESIRVAVSKPDVAATATLFPTNWNVFAFKTGNCPDQPWISISSNKVAISVNTHVKKSDTECTDNFLGTQTLLINKDDLINNALGPAFKITPTVSKAKPNLKTFREVPVRTFGTDEKIVLVSIQKNADGNNLNAIKLKTISGTIRNDLSLPASAISTQIIPFKQKGPPKPAPDGIQPGTNKCVSDTQLRPCIKTGFLQVSSAHMSSDNTVLMLVFHESCKNPGAPPARKIISCIRVAEIDTNPPGQIGSPKAVMTQDFNIVRKNMDLYYPTVTFDGSRTLGTNFMTVGFGGSNSTVFPSLFASGQRGTITLPVIELKKGGSANQLPPANGKEKPKARYGDYFGSAFDPIDPTIRWIAGEYMQKSTPTPPPRWSSAISKVTLLPLGTGSTSTGNAVTSPQAAINSSSGSGVCNDGTLPDVNNLCADGSQPQPQVNATTAVAPTAEQLICNDGTLPDVNNLCADGSQPQPQP
jgi:peptidoglycan hydrolase-like protein with peptidoglycan-binding domain